MGETNDERFQKLLCGIKNRFEFMNTIKYKVYYNIAISFFNFLKLRRIISIHRGTT